MYWSLISFWSTLRISWMKLLSYRIDFILQVIGPVSIFFFIQVSLWQCIFGQQQIVNGYTFESMLRYQFCTLIISLLGQGYMGYDIGNDIRLGRISSYLLYPVSFWQFHTAGFFAFQAVQLFICLLAVFSGYLFFTELQFAASNLFHGLYFVFLVSTFWFLVQSFTGLLAFWLEETWILRVIINIIAKFLSGAIIPLDFFPDYVRTLLSWTPFPLLNFYPAKIISEGLTPGFHEFGILASWMILAIIVLHLLWKRGLRHYTAAGI